MIHSRTSLLTLILAVFISGSYAHAQRDNTSAETEELAALREKAFKLLESVAGQLSTLQSAENRARMGSNLVESLWKHDEQRARSLLRMVQEDIRNELQKPEPGRLRNWPRFEVFLRLRDDTVQRVAKHDGEAALEFLRITTPIFEEGREPYDFHWKEQALQLNLAQQVAANNPEIALKLGRQALEQGFSRDLLNLLSKLNRKHKAHARIFNNEIVGKLRDADMDDWNVRTIAQAMVQGFAPPDSDESTYRELINLLVSRALERGCGKPLSEVSERAEFCTFVATSIRSADGYDSRAARIKHWAKEGHPSQQFSFVFNEIWELFKEGNVEQLETFAATNPELHTQIYARLAYSMAAEGDFAGARKMIGRLAVDSEPRKELIAHVDRLEQKAVAGEERLAAVQTRIAEFPDLRSRAYFLIGEANLFGVSDRNAALKLLNQAFEMTQSMAPGKEQTQTLIILALMYATQKSDRGFAIMESVVPKLNELVDVAAKLNGYDTNYLREGEWNMSANGATGEILTQLSQQAGRFAWCDFDRAVSLASQFERPEIRMMAHLKLAQSVLAGPPKTLRYGP